MNYFINVQMATVTVVHRHDLSDFLTMFEACKINCLQHCRDPPDLVFTSGWFFCLGSAIKPLSIQVQIKIQLFLANLTIAKWTFPEWANRYKNNKISAYIWTVGYPTRKICIICNSKSDYNIDQYPYCQIAIITLRLINCPPFHLHWWTNITLLYE